MDPSLPNTWRRLGLLGLARSAWTRSAGRVLDVRCVIDWSLETASARFTPVSGYRFERAAILGDSATAEKAARLTGVRLEERLSLELFVARDQEDRMAACTWNEPPQDGVARHRGVAVEGGHRGRSLGGSLLLFQASELAARGVKRILYRTDIGNRASRRMFHRIGADWSGATALLVVLGRRRAVKALGGRAEILLRGRWERERKRVRRG